jgi:hypothetical protein
MVKIEIGSADGRGFGAGPDDRLAGLEHRGPCLELRAHVERLRASGNTDANDRDGGNQRDTYDLKVSQSASSMHARVIHDLSPQTIP